MVLPLTDTFEIVSTTFDLTTDERADNPEFTITCRTQGGPATRVQWFGRQDQQAIKNNASYEMSQHIVNGSEVTVYDNKLKVRGRRYGEYMCIIGIGEELQKSNDVSGKRIEVYFYEN